VNDQVHLLSLLANIHDLLTFNMSVSDLFIDILIT
jgi:hypothetical protein